MKQRTLKKHYNEETKEINKEYMGGLRNINYKKYSGNKRDKHQIFNGFKLAYTKGAK